MMKLFKKLLAVAMVAVLALTVLTGCDTGTTDPDAVYPDDETESVVYALNNGAAAANQPQLTYSVKYSKITKELLDNYLDNYGNISKYPTKRLGMIRDAFLLSFRPPKPKPASDRNVPAGGWLFVRLIPIFWHSFVQRRSPRRSRPPRHNRTRSGRASGRSSSRPG